MSNVSFTGRENKQDVVFHYEARDADTQDKENEEDNA